MTFGICGIDLDPIVKNGDLVPEDITRYPGGKGGPGVYQTIINLIPPHETYIETHLGGGAIMRHKKPARKNIGIDVHPGVIDKWHGIEPGITVINDDAIRFLRNYSFRGNEFVYSDPPYLLETRKCGKIYDFEYTTEDHVRLLKVLKSLPCMVMVSGYHSALYDDTLSWNKKSFEAITRGGSRAVEYVWYNYPTPVRLHDYSYLGSNFRERERIKRKVQRWIEGLQRLPILERNAILNALNDNVITTR